LIRFLKLVFASLFLATFLPFAIVFANFNITIYNGTAFDTSMYTEYIDGWPTYYIFHHRPPDSIPSPESITVTASSNFNFSDFDDGAVYFGTFFNTSLYINVVDGFASNYIFRYVPKERTKPEFNLPSISAFEHSRNLQRNRTTPIVFVPTEYSHSWLKSITPEQIMGFIILITVFSVLGVFACSFFRKNNTNTEGAHYHSDKWSTNPKHLDSLDLYNNSNTPKLYKNHLQKHKLEPLPDSLFRNSNESWPTNPKLYNGVELALNNQTSRLSSLPNEAYVKKHKLDTSIIKIECPVCQGMVTKKRHPISKTNLYSCNNAIKCDFEVNDINKIHPFKVIDTGKHPITPTPTKPSSKHPNYDFTKCPNCDGYLIRSQRKSTNMPVYICSNSPDCKYAPLENNILDENNEF